MATKHVPGVLASALHRGQPDAETWICAATVSGLSENEIPDISSGASLFASSAMEILDLRAFRPIVENNNGLHIASR